MGVLDRFRLDGKRLFISGGSRGLGREMALAIAEVTAEGADLLSEEAQDRIAGRWFSWAAAAKDVGIQTRQVLGSASRTVGNQPTAAELRAAAAELHRQRHDPQDHRLRQVDLADHVQRRVAAGPLQDRDVARVLRPARVAPAPRCALPGAR